MTHCPECGRPYEDAVTAEDCASFDRLETRRPTMPKATDNPLIPARLRDWAYPVITAAVVLLGAYGIIAEEQVPLWIGLGAALLGTGTATAYRPRRTVEPLQAEVAVAKGAAEARRAAVRPPDEMGG